MCRAVCKVEGWRAAGSVLTLLVLAIFAGNVQAEQRPKNYVQTLDNEWLVYSKQYAQYVDVKSGAQLSKANAILLLKRNSNVPHESGMLYFPGPACLYVDGKMRGYFANSVVDINAYQGQYGTSLAFYIPKSYDALAGSQELKRQKPSRYTKAPNRFWKDSLLSTAFLFLLSLLLGTRDKEFFRVLSPSFLLKKRETYGDEVGLAEFFGYQSVLHIILTVISMAVYLFVLRYGPNSFEFYKNGDLGYETLSLLAGFAWQTLLALLVVSAFIYIIGLSLFNIKIEGTHVRANLEFFSIVSLLLALLSFGFNFNATFGLQNFVSVSRLLLLVAFVGKGFYLYKILITDKGIKKFYSFSYICLTEILPSIFLFRLLAER